MATTPSSSSRTRGADQQPEAIQRISNRWGGRKQEVKSLVQLLGGDQCQPALDLYVYGGRSTGKTSVVRSVLEELELAHVFINCRAYTKPGQLLQAAASGLKGSARGAASNYAPDATAPRQMPEFLSQLPSLCPEDGSPCYIVLDDAQRLAQKPLLAPLLRLRELSGGCNVGIILIASMGWEAFLHDTLAEQQPLPAFFRPYEDNDIMHILMGAQGGQPGERDEIYPAFVRSTMPPFIRATRSLRALHRVASQLFDVYRGFLKDGAAKQGTPQAVHRLLKPHVLAALDNFQSGTGLCYGTTHQVASGGVIANKSAEKLDFELPYMSKYLLVAAYIASRNRPATDKRVFDISGGRKRRRCSVGAMQADKHAEAAKVAALAGPGSFEMERLLAIFWSVLNGNEDSVCPAENAQSSEVLMQISSLVSLRLLSQVSGDDVLDKCKYRCNVSDELAQRVAKNLKVELNNYLTYV